MNQSLPQFEFITNEPNNTKVSGANLIGDIDFMYGNAIKLFPPDNDLKLVLFVKTGLTTTDTSLNIVESETELWISFYHYNHQVGIEEIYGLFCYATIFNYMAITNSIRDNGILHNETPYIPTVVIPSFSKMKDEIRSEINLAYGLS